MSKLNIKNIKSFVEGHSKLFLNRLGLFPKHKQEQILYRLDKCKNDCVPNGKCKFCGCPPHKKAYVNESCNGGIRFPNMMTPTEWEDYKAKMNIKIKNDD